MRPMTNSLLVSISSGALLAWTGCAPGTPANVSQTEATTHGADASSSTAPTAGDATTTGETGGEPSTGGESSTGGAPTTGDEPSTGDASSTGGEPAGTRPLWLRSFGN